MSSRLLRVLGIGVGVVVGVLAVVVAALFLPPVRNALLKSAIEIANGSLPGTIRVETSYWPSLGVIELSGVVWKDGPDVLVTADRLAIDVSLTPLVRGDIDVRRVTLLRAYGNVPAIQSRFASTDRMSEEGPAEDSGGFPREGSLPGAPSIAVHSIHVTADSVRWSEDGVVTGFELMGGIDLRHGESPRVALERAALQMADRDASVDDLRLDVDLARGVLEGTGGISLSPELTLYTSLHSRDAERFSLVLSAEESRSPPDAIGLSIEGRLVREGLDVKAVEFEAELLTPGTRELAGTPLADRVAELPELDGLSAALRGVVELQPALAADVVCEIRENSWIESARIELDYGAEILDLRRATLDLGDLRLEADGAVDPDSMRVRVDVVVEGTDWLRALQPKMEAPDSLQLRLSGAGRLSRRARILDAYLGLSGHASGVTVDSTTVRAQWALDPSRSSNVHIDVSLFDLEAELTARIERGDEMVVALAPIAIRAAGEAPVDVPVETGRIAYSPAERRVRVDALRVVGALGEFLLSGDLDSQSARYDLECVWSEPPSPLLAELSLSDEARASLEPSWAKDAPYSVAVRGSATLDDGSGNHRGDGPAVDGTISFRLPGPNNLSGLVPGDLEGLGPLAGEMELHSRKQGESMLLEAALSLQETAWLDSSDVRVHGTLDSLAIDEAHIAFEGLHAMVTGVTGSSHDLRGRIVVDDARLLRRFVPDGPSVHLEADASWIGPRASPRLEAAMKASAGTEGWEVSELTGRGVWAENEKSLAIEAGRGTRVGGLVLDRASASYEAEGEGGSLWPATVSTSAAGDGLEFHQRSRIDLGDTVSIAVDSLSFAADEQRLDSGGPFRITLLPEGEGLLVDDLQLAGSMGSVVAAGFARPGGSDLSANLDLALPGLARRIGLADAVTPTDVSARIAAHPTGEMEASARLRGFVFDEGRTPVLEIELHGDATKLTGRAELADETGSFLEADVDLPAALTVYPPSLASRPGELTVTADLHRAPVPVRIPGELGEVAKERIAVVTGDIRLGGTMDALAGTWASSLRFPEWPKLDTYRIDVQGELTPGSSSSESDVRVEVRMEHGDKIVLQGDATSPAHLSLVPLAWNVAAERDAELHLTSSGFPLTDFDAVLPLDVGLEGFCRLELSAEGPPREARLDGFFETSDLRLTYTNTARINATADIQFSGTVAEPAVTGEIKIPKATIFIPEPPPNLLPTEGTAILRTLERPDAPAVVDTIEVVEPVPAFVARADLTVKIPGNFWVRGHGLDVELAGDLDVTKSDGTAKIVGQLRAVQGSLRFLGRNLRLERGTVKFGGEEEIDPALDFLLTTEVSGTRIYILFAGTASDPKVTLTSEPDMREPDIMSTLLFGKQYDNLDEGQTDMMESRTAELIASVGALKLQEQLAGQVGVDVVTVQESAIEPKSSAISVGKYLSNRVLLSWARPLDDRSPPYVRLEYFLRGRFKLDSLYGRDNQSALGVGWEADY